MRYAEFENLKKTVKLVKLHKTDPKTCWQACKTDKTDEVKEDTTSEEIDYSSMTVPELKDALKEKGLPVSGKKAELVERLEGSN